MLYFRILLACIYLVLAVPISAEGKKRYALLIGLQTLDPHHKSGESFDDEATKGVPHDISTIKSRLSQQADYEITILMNAQATLKGILAEIKRIGRLVNPGDAFVLYFSGHGDQVPDLSRDEVEDGQDEVLVAYDDYLVDDQINSLLANYFKATQNVMIVDACHSASSYKMFLVRGKPKLIHSRGSMHLTSRNVVTAEKSSLCNYTPKGAQKAPYTLIYLGATADDQTTGGDAGGGYFTQALDRVFSEASEEGRLNNLTYKELACKISIALGSPNLEYVEIRAEGFSSTSVFSF